MLCIGTVGMLWIPQEHYGIQKAYLCFSSCNFTRNDEKEANYKINLNMLRNIMRPNILRYHGIKLSIETEFQTQFDHLPQRRLY